MNKIHEINNSIKTASYHLNKKSANIENFLEYFT